jgi:two-component system, NarL family, invasion response regulator UvrY
LNRYRVLLADDHPLIRAGIADLLEGDSRLEVSGQVDSFTALWKTLDEDPLPHVVVMDLKMPGGSGLAAVTHLHERYPSVRVLVLTTFPEESFVVLMIRAGASGYLEKTASADRIVDAIHAVAGGELVVSSAGARVLARALGPGRVHTHLDLSDRELDVLRLMGTGLSASQIAGELGISVKTVSTYRARLSEKMGLATSAEIIRYALEHGLAD